MKKLLSFGLLLASAIGMNAQQLPNVGFESWKATCGQTLQTSNDWGNATSTATNFKTRPGVEPTDWNGSNVNQKVVAAVSEAGFVTKQGAEGNYWAKLTNLEVGAFGITACAPAYLTFGTPWSHAAKDNQDGGTYGGVAFTNKPDAIKGKYRRSNVPTEKAHIIAYFWTGTFTSKIGASNSPKISMDNVERAILGKSNAGTITGDGQLIASCDYEFTTTTNNDWQEIVVPITYKNLETAPTMMNVIISSADYWTRGNMVANSTLEVDDVEFVYYHTLKAISYDGLVLAENPVEGSTVEYCTESTFDEAKLTLDVNGVGATTSTSYDSATGILTINVFGNDYNADTNPSSKSVYYVKFINPSSIQTYTNSLFIDAKDAGGKQFNETKDIKVLTYETTSGTRKDLKLSDFSFGSGEESMYIGDIIVEDVNVAQENGSEILTCTNKLTPIAGLGGMELPITLNSTSKGNDMLATIDIILGETVINVVFAPAVTMDGSAAITATGLTNVKVVRSFKQGWNTLALPFAITTDELGTGVKAQEFTGVTTDGSGLNFTAVTSLEANKPYLVYFPAATDVPEYFGTNISAVDETGVTHGAYTFKPNFSNPSLSMAGNYGVVTADGVSKIMKGGAGSTLQTIRAYFTGNGAETARIYFDGETTGIEAMTNTTANGKIYNLQGVEVSGKLPAGVYVKNGEKVIIK